MSTAQEPSVVWAKACDPATWPPMPGAKLAFRVVDTDPPHRMHYCIEAGLPVRDHDGELSLEPTATGGTEIVLHESFRGRLWGTAGYLRGRRERALVDLARAWGSAPDSSR